MERRSFIKGLILGGLAARFSPAILAEPAPPELAVVQGETPAAITKEAIKVLGGMEKFISRGDKVLIKPNIGWDRAPEMAACTNPEVVKTLVEMSYKAGAKEVIVMDNTINQAKRCYARSGIQEAAREAGAKECP
jgi:uncharacterized protein (DUF362 family)